MAKIATKCRINEITFNNLQPGECCLPAPVSNSSIELAIPKARRSSVWCDILVSITAEPPTIEVSRLDGVPLQLAMYDHSMTKRPTKVLAKPMPALTFYKPPGTDDWSLKTEVKHFDGLRCFA